MIEFRTSKGNKMSFDDKPLNQGGEGAIYKQYDKLGHGDVGDLAKIFHKGKEKGKEEKIKAMLSIQSPTPSSNFTWPKEILYDVNTGAFCGYVMYMKYNMEELGSVAAQNCQYRNSKGWFFYLSIAKSLAQTVASLHSIDQVIGDLNDKNVLIDMGTARVTLIDNDSFHISVDSVTHRCSVGMGEYLAPELQGINFCEDALPTFTKSTDNFSLAILIFKLLMNGLHPFNSATIDECSIEENIKNGHSPFFLNAYKDKSIGPPYAPPIDLLPAKLYKLFKLAFNDSLKAPHKRPTAQEFYDALDSLSIESGIEKCPIKDHDFPKGMPSCPWCYVEDKMHLLGQNGVVSDDFTYNSFTKIYKKSVSKIKVNKYEGKSNNKTRPEDTDYTGFEASQQNTTTRNIIIQQGSQSVLALNNATVSPVPISSTRKTMCVLGCVGISAFTIFVCVAAYIQALPLIAIIAAVLIAILAIIYMPKLNSYDVYKTIVEFPDYITVKCKEKKRIWYVIVPKVKVILFTFLALSVMIGLCVATALGDKKEILWSWISFSLVSIFNTFYITEKRTLWTKTVLGIILGVFSILTIILSIILFASLLSKLFPL